MTVNVLVITVVATLLIAVAVAAPIGVGLLCLRIWQWLLSRMTSPSTDNRILYWPVSLAILWPLLFASVWLFCETSLWWGIISVDFSIVQLISVYFSVIMGLGLATMWIGSLVVACRLMIRWVAARQWHMALSILILPLTSLLVLLSSPFLWKVSGTVADYVEFFGNYPLYLAHLEKRAATEPRFIIWASGEYDDSAVLYDETDEIASDHPSGAWKKKAEEQGVVCCKHRHIIGHFYWVEFDLSQGDVRKDVMRGYDLYKSGRIAPRH